MFEVAELGQKLDKEQFNARVPELRIELIQIQETLRVLPFPVIILISGVDGAGKGETVNRLHEWFDPRYLRTFAFGERSDEERERPPYWRYWRSLPPKGHIGLYVGSWYSDPIADRVDGRISEAELDAHLIRISTFEKALVDDGALVIKFWLHLSKDAQKKRLKGLQKNPDTAWLVTDRDLAHLKSYDLFRSVAERTLRETSTGEAPWTIVDGSDPRYRHVTVAEHILARLDEHIQQRNDSLPSPPPRSSLPVTPRRSATVLDVLDLDKRVEKRGYEKRLEKLQARIGLLAREARFKKVSTIIVLEGWDAAGKGGIIRRIVPAMDARNYQIIPIAAPTDEERAHHYLWRFWRHIPRAGFATIYDRSWYGRVLVERIEGFAKEQEWLRAYHEINDFEEQLVEHGIVLVKYWVHISKEEQLARFKEREQIPWKKHKITEEDYRNRERWDDYVHAVNDMVERTSTEYAPWNLIEGNDKRHARIAALEVLGSRLERAVELKGK